MPMYNIYMHIYIRTYIRMYIHIHTTHIHMCLNADISICDQASEKDQVGTQYTISQNGEYLEIRAQYVLSVS